MKSAVRNIREGRLDLAELDLKSAKGMAPNHPLVWYYDGVVQFRMHNFEAAASSMKKSIELGVPGPEDAYYYMGFSYMRLKRYDEAIDSLEKAISIRPDIPVFYYVLSACYADKGEKRKAVETIDKAIALDPENEAFKELKQDIERLL